jgi:hypothetical protein
MSFHYMVSRTLHQHRLLLHDRLLASSATRTRRRVSPRHRGRLLGLITRRIEIHDLDQHVAAVRRGFLHYRTLHEVHYGALLRVQHPRWLNEK